MKSNFIYTSILLFHLVVPNTIGQDSIPAVSLNSFDLMPVLNPWLSSTNPAGLSLNPSILPGKMNLGYHHETGDFKRVQQGESLNHYNFQTQRYTKIENTFFYGSFSYDKSFEKGIDYSNVNNPYRGTPYLLIDTIGNDIYDREFFSLKGVLSTPLNHYISWGISSDFNVGLASQNRDPRPRNKVLKLSVSPGLLFSYSKLDIGFNLLYSYYNEDIGIDIIEKFRQMAFFQLHGLGTYITHVAGSFNRLYKQNSFGGEAQVNYKAGSITSLLGVKLLYVKEIANDGRKAGDASWSYVKNDSEFEGTNLEIYNTTIINHNSSIHYFHSIVKINSMLGAEILQRIETSGETDATNWVTYAKEEKYCSYLIDAELSYSYLKMKEEFIRNYEFKFAVNYYGFEQAYYIPNREESYKNLILSLGFDKSFYLNSHIFSISTGLKYKQNISSNLNFEENTFIYYNILLPDYNFLTTDFYAPWLKLSYEIPLNIIFDKYFFMTRVDLYRGNNDQTRTIFNFSTGVIF